MSPSSAISTWLGWAAGFFRPNILDLRCTSARAGKSLVLQGYILDSADELSISFAVRWPKFLFAPSRRVGVGLAVGPGPRSTGPPRAIRSSLRLCELRQSVVGRMTQVQARFRVETLKPGDQIELMIHENRRGGRVGRKHFTVIDETNAQRLRLESLKVEAQQLWIHNGDQSYQGELLVDTSEFVTAHLIIRDLEPAELLPIYQTSISWTLLTGTKRTALGTKTIALGAAPISVKTEPISVKDATLFPSAGSYSLVAVVAGREIATFRFEILTRQEWLRQLKVERIELVAETADKQIRPEPSGALRWGLHVAFQASVHLRASAPAPNTPLKFTARLARGDAVLRTEECLLRHDQTLQKVWLERFNLSDLGTFVQARRLRLSLSVELDHQTKAVETIIILPVETLSNCEGQLNCTQDDLPLDEEDYQEILAQLASKPLPRVGDQRFGLKKGDC